MCAQDKKKMKQFELKDKESCIIYLMRIISTIDLCLYKFKEYIKQHKALVDKYNNEKVEKVSIDVYSEMLDKTANIEGYLLNIIGDAQETSISYFKFRKLAERLIKSGKSEIRLSPLSDELSFHLSEFNRLRNWQNHVPESLLTSEISLIDEGTLLSHPKNPIQVFYYSYVSFDYFKDLYTTNAEFYKVAKMLHQAAKKDYSLLIGESVRIERVFTDKVKSIEHFAATKKSAQIQGLKTEES